MTRLLLVVCAVFVVGPARAADPQPVWEIVPSIEKLETRSVRWLGFTPDGKTLVARVEFLDRAKLPRADEILAYPERLLAWDIATRKEQFNLDIGKNQFHEVGLQASAMTRAGTVLVGGTKPREIRLTDGQEKPLPYVPDRAAAVWIDPASRESIWFIPSFNPDFRLATGKLSPFDGDPKKDAGKLKWKTVPLKVEDVEAETITVAVSPNLKQLMVATRGGEKILRAYTVERDDTVHLTEVATVTPAHLGAIRAMRFSHDGKTLATGSEDSSIFLWDVSKVGKDWKPYATIPAGNLMVSVLAFSPDGRTLAAGTLDQHAKDNLYLIDVRGGKLVSARQLEQAVTALAYSPDGQTLVTGLFLGKIQAWNAAAVRGD